MSLKGLRASATTSPLTYPPSKKKQTNFKTEGSTLEIHCKAKSGHTIFHFFENTHVLKSLAISAPVSLANGMCRSSSLLRILLLSEFAWRQILSPYVIYAMTYGKHKGFGTF